MLQAGSYGLSFRLLLLRWRSYQSFARDARVLRRTPLPFSGKVRVFGAYWSDNGVVLSICSGSWKEKPIMIRRKVLSIHGFGALSLSGLVMGLSFLIVDVQSRLTGSAGPEAVDRGFDPACVASCGAGRRLHFPADSAA